MTIESQLEQLTGRLPDGISESVALGTGLAEGYDFYESALGQVIVTFNPNGVSSLDIADGFEDRYTERFGRPLIRAEAPAAWKGHVQESIERGTPGKLPVDLGSVTVFQGNVLRTTATIPKGEVRPYGWVAREIDSPKAVRAVGSAVARNPIPLIIPCHRVVRTDGHIGNYSLGGPHNKIELLEHEGARPDELEQLAAHNIRVRANTSTGVYCHPTCSAIRRSKESNVVGFGSASSAEEAGYVPCKLCRPHG
ncbi:MAG TPA: methylated-DNA--[protein]-cysteine S-methyltransferase [Acidimicrobiia bacterium]|nr:methylated-DNA--[protein]-cysteine S-methyltransferase [Acidimicrobiia bacterium]